MSLNGLSCKLLDTPGKNEIEDTKLNNENFIDFHVMSFNGET